MKILDLCAGTGNISLEFASREAGMITSVDTNYNCCRFIQKMIDENNLNQVMNVVKSDVRDYVRRCEQTYDLIFMDVGLPGINGIEATVKIRYQGGINHQAPIVALTAHTDKRTRQRCSDVGMDDFLAKPFDNSEMKKVLMKFKLVTDD